MLRRVSKARRMASVALSSDLEDDVRRLEFELARYQRRLHFWSHRAEALDLLQASAGERLRLEKSSPAV
jgi:hypothetical protein